jgi:hypothetical protein
MPVTFSSSVVPVLLPTQSPNPDQYADIEAVIMGWGPESKERSSTDLLNIY